MEYSTVFGGYPYINLTKDDTMNRGIAWCEDAAGVQRSLPVGNAAVRSNKIDLGFVFHQQGWPQPEREV